MSVISRVGRKSLALTLTSAMAAVFALTGASAAHASVAAATIRLADADKAPKSMTEKTYWASTAEAPRTCSATTSCDYVKMITAGSDLVLHYNVTDANGNGIAGTAVTLNVSVPDGATAGTFTGTLSGTTDSSGGVTFTLHNTNTSANSEPYPIGLSNIGFWNDSRGGLIGTPTQYNIVPTVGAATEAVDSVMVHPVKSPLAAANIRLTSADKAGMSDKTFWASTGGVPCDSSITCSYVKFVVAGDDLNLHYVVTNADGNPVANTPVALNLGQPDGAIPTTYTGDLYKTTDANGAVTFALHNTAADSAAEPRPSGESTMTYWADSRKVDQVYALDFTPSVGATTEAVDRVWSHTVQSAAVAGTANIYLTESDRAGMTDKSTVWWTNEPSSYSRVKFTYAGGPLVLHYVVTNGAGTPLKNTPVTLATSKNSRASLASFTGSLTNNTDNDGKVTFTLTNTNTRAQSEPYPYAPSSMSYWDDSREDLLKGLLVDQLETDFTPTVGADVEHIDRVWAHVVKADVPTAPQAVSVQATSTSSAVISWSAPTHDGNGALSSYTYTLKNNGVAVPGASGTITVSPTPTPSATPTASATPKVSATVTGLISSGKYSVSVTANNAEGSSVGASSVGTVTPVASTSVKVPGVVTAPAAVGGNASATVTWTAPAANNGASLISYSIAVKDGSNVVDTVTVPADNTVKSASNVSVTGALVGGLTNGKPYTFAISATNAVGTSAPVATAAVTPFTLPGAPTGVSVTRGNASLTVNWTAPTSNGGSPLTGYVVTYVGKPTLVAASSLTKTVSALATATSVSIPKLVNGVTYNVTVKAVTAKGSSSASTPVTGTPSTVPVVLKTATAVKGSGSAIVSWTSATNTGTVASNGGSDILRYEITVKQGTTALDTYNAIPTATSKVINGLANGTAYTFSVVAVNAVGKSVAKVTTAATPSTTPDAPTIGTTAQTSTTSLTVNWTAPASTGGSAITGYEIKVYSGGVQIGTAKTAAATAKTLVVTGLTTKTAYTFTVAAKNINGTGTASSPSVAVSTK